MSYQGFLKKLQAFGVLFGPRARKLTGLQDTNNRFSDTILFTAPNLITLTFSVPAFLRERTYFRVTGGGGPNQDLVFRVKKASGNVIEVDSTSLVTTFGPAPANIDARVAVVQNNPLVSRLNSEGNTVFNVSNGSVVTGYDWDLGPVLAEHYHFEGGVEPGQIYTQHFAVSDWFVTDAGDTYSLDITHNLDMFFPVLSVWEDITNEEVWVHKTKILDANSLRISVTKAGADARFAGTIKVEH